MIELNRTLLLSDGRQDDLDKINVRRNLLLNWDIFISVLAGLAAFVTMVLSLIIVKPDGSPPPSATHAIAFVVCPLIFLICLTIIMRITKARDVLGRQGREISRHAVHYILANATLREKANKVDGMYSQAKEFCTVGSPERIGLNEALFVALTALQSLDVSNPDPSLFDSGMANFGAACDHVRAEYDRGHLVIP